MTEIRRGRPSAARVLTECAGCGTLIERKVSEVESGRRLFCTTECARQTGLKPRTGIDVGCAREGCDVRFYRAAASGQVYCSAACRDLANRAPTEHRLCAHCAGPFDVRPSDPDIYCSRRCYDEARRSAARTTRKVTSDGYVTLYRPEHPNAQPSTGRVMEHVLVMSEHIGRALLPWEEVHHRISHRKDDNRLGNLELWTKSHPSGNRVDDVVVWCRSQIALYGTPEEREQYAASLPVEVR